MRTHRLVFAALFALASSACECGRPIVGEDGGAGDAGPTVDAGSTDGGGNPDGGSSDGGGTPDSGIGSPCTAPVSCYTGPAGTLGVGVCAAGVQQCVDGGLGPCVGEVLPSAEVCNGLDDDCNGAPDDGLGTVTCGQGVCQATVNACVGGKASVCTPGDAGPQEICGNGLDDNCNGLVDEGCNCIYVAPNGNDSNSGNATNPLLTINAAIAKAASLADAGIGVCVASGAAAPSTATYTEDVVMANGISVLGGYVSGSWNRPGLAGGARTVIQSVGAQGVVFDHPVTAPTALDGFVVQAGDAGTNAAITVRGSTGAIISNDRITGGAGTDSVGVDIMNVSALVATPLLTNDAITGGSGSAQAVGVHSLGSAPIISSNCATFDTAGRCTTYACGGAATSFILGRAVAAGGTPGTNSYGIFLESSPGALVETSGVCSGASAGDSAGILVQGPATGTILRGNSINGSFATNNSVGAWFKPCGGASPWLFDNAQVSGRSSTVGSRGDGVRAVGDCHVRVDSNQSIVGGIELAQAPSYGVACLLDTGSGISSQCQVIGNVSIRGSGSGYPPVSAGVRCDDGACARVENNASITGQQGTVSIGLSLGATGTSVNNNGIFAGCASTQAIGLEANDSFARVQNNVIHGGLANTACPNAASNDYGVLITVGTGPNELDLDSNDIFGEGSTTACTSRGVSVGAGATAPPAGPRGLIRSNIIHGGSCPTSYSFEESSAAADPSTVENNDLWGTSALTALYLDEGTTNLTTIAAVNALTDKAVAQNISADPLYVSTTDFHLTGSSPCIDTGADAGCPATDFDGDTRPRGPACDIGADEY